MLRPDNQRAERLLAERRGRRARRDLPRIGATTVLRRVRRRAGRREHLRSLADLLGWRGCSSREATRPRGARAQVPPERPRATRCGGDARERRGAVRRGRRAAEPELLSIDVDGEDYWIWEAMSRRPRVVVIEYNSGLEPGRRLVQPRGTGRRGGTSFAARRWPRSRRSASARATGSSTRTSRATTCSSSPRRRRRVRRTAGTWDEPGAPRPSSRRRAPWTRS